MAPLIQMLAAALLAPVEPAPARPAAAPSMALRYEVRFLDVTVQGQRLRLAYRDVSPAARAAAGAVLLLHGKNFSGAYWEETIEALAAAGYRVVAPDQIG